MNPLERWKATLGRSNTEATLSTMGDLWREMPLLNSPRCSYKSVCTLNSSNVNRTLQAQVFGSRDRDMVHHNDVLISKKAFQLTSNRIEGKESHQQALDRIEKEEQKLKEIRSGVKSTFKNMFKKGGANPFGGLMKTKTLKEVPVEPNTKATLTKVQSTEDLKKVRSFGGSLLKGSN